MALRECEVFFLGTASRKGGNNSSIDCNEGKAMLNGLWVAHRDGSIVAASMARPNVARKDGSTARVCTNAAMLRLTRPLFNHALKTSTGIVGLKVHPNPLPQLKQTYESTLAALVNIPATSVYRQGVEALTQRKLKILEGSQGNVDAAEKQLDEGNIEESLEIANDELKLVYKMIEWKAWEPLEEKPEPGQWEYFGKPATAS
ncbi:hypothetical protein K474DRAFT_1696788 [Panus rudis PR-1116 ss-1]|nr:hypothetical protein K474DRAFT_1696788 [Panus rudis PR-1116 ss-1]